ncbi:hypothetical protein BURMUCGD2M_0509 [Burkholderia multivorans CGD2M]|uniref:Uncharacterized protein n=1 Tax=Burkholderia multivorans CGD2 TaxID=513052 RepID=B9BZ35_9BURK|nr:hypothetical protein BURMUCGD2_3265 [Burkholderia multivorans CGD2]EEE12413.1 hypothetical protein BURMUCGD2M_0509 [Burkholderia multivorans CGD2M]
MFFDGVVSGLSRCSPNKIFDKGINSDVFIISIGFQGFPR